jgi:cyclic beta-1,2-glucan synthetase
LIDGLRPDQATCVVIPSMMRNRKALDKLFARLEVNYIGNRSEQIFFVLLLDFTDAPAEIMPEDGALLDEVKKRTEALNAKYPSRIPTFYTLYRKRIWNQNEAVFMGWERKRGKLREFNWLIRGTKPTSYVTDGPLSLPHIKYVITLDEDTELPREGAHKLIGCIDHVLNRPVLTKDGTKVVRGYGIIQPRASTRMNSADRTFFSRLFSSAVGVDSYSGPAADMYQDLFGAGIFYGKGIYDIDAVESTMDDTIPENRVLSHDLLEGIYARTGFASHIQVFEGFPPRYSEFSLRHRRWIRGDWQIISWLFGRGKGFSFIDRWKIADNLRRSLLPVAVALTLVLVAFFSPRSIAASSLFVLAVFCFSGIIGTLYASVLRLRWKLIWIVLSQAASQVWHELERAVIRSALVLYEALMNVREITLTFFRMLVSHKRMLQWKN